MKCGVPQGSVLGPLLFLLYVNDICDNVKSPLTLFPDDTNIFEDLRPGNHKLTDTLMLVDSWMKSNMLKCNLDKSKAVIFGRKPHQMLADLHGVSIENCEKLGCNPCRGFAFQRSCSKGQEKALLLQLYSASIGTISNTVATHGLL